MASNIASAYLVKGTAGHIGPGAPILSFTLVVTAKTGKLSGHAEITQALPPPFGSIEINNVTGKIHKLGLRPATMVVTLEGTYGQGVTPPAVGYSLQHFRTVFNVDDAWNGFGSFEYGEHTVSNVPVRTVD
jgi:hypothetical protein